MRIVLLTSSSTRSGGSLQAYYLARELTDRGHEVRFAVPRDSSLPEIDPGLHWLLLPRERKHWRAEIEKIMAPPTVLHAFHNKACKLAAWWGLRLRRKGNVVLLNRGVCYRPGNPLPYWSPGVDAYTVNSQACGRVLRRLGTPRSKLHVVRSGVPASRAEPHRSPADVRAELGLEPGQTVVGSVAGDKPVKGVDVLVRAVASLEDFSGRCLIIGANPDKWRPLAEELGRPERFVFVSRTPQVADYLQVMHLFVLPSRSESMPNTLVEAVMAGLPVVATRVGGVPELVDGNGLLVPPDDPAAMSRAIGESLANEVGRRAWAKRSLELAENYTLAAKADRVERLYGSLLLKRGLAYQSTL
ncbi:glycosyltransferase family 4 protein [Desulfohalovibrio reitneri]|uniref:glycosyltransferase family 4 protein n=1 Tax=Desulfohalovibrio reitneri TaxID=1307759 RepID=UPI0004A6FC70|nr:glycosyltransferase family 4 protein [Desulfohalovibrio reitneri]